MYKKSRNVKRKAKRRYSKNKTTVASMGWREYAIG
jgi:hypothetical protein